MKDSITKILSMAGLARRAGKVVSGEFSVMEALKKRTAGLVLIAEDASDNTKKKFSDKCSFRKVPFYVFGTKESLGAALGQEERSCIAFTDSGFADAVKTMIEKQMN